MLRVLIRVVYMINCAFFSPTYVGRSAGCEIIIFVVGRSYISKVGSQSREFNFFVLIISPYSMNTPLLLASVHTPYFLHQGRRPHAIFKTTYREQLPCLSSGAKQRVESLMRFTAKRKRERDELV